MDKAFLIAFNRTQAKPVAVRVLKADDPASRSKGLLGRESMAPDEGLWIALEKSQSILKGCADP